MKTDAVLLEKAKQYAFLLLKYRQRSCEELRQRMRRKKFPAEVIERTIDFLSEKKFLDDDAFARDWISSRISQSVGPRRISQELKQKGVPRETIERSLGELRESYSESEVLEELAENRLRRMKGMDPQTARRRLFGYLVRRGFSSDEIVDCLNKLID